ncbi:hypothetical protein G5I_05515 [Acromyrmex echinatior]|uniref:Uncharacterized protein n=1 Tax=Acromyrmex echinatior TaxID=103372 RepID=F4WIJ1_ACREC|nr:hypothetical protein G5I_05515 [Acromyrmex echinatior]
MGKSNCLVAYVFFLAIQIINEFDTNFDSPSRVPVVFGMTQLPNPTRSVRNSHASLILLRNEFRPKRYAAFAAIRRYGKSARWSQFCSPSGDLGFPTGHNSSLTPNASSSLRASQFIQHLCAVRVLLGMIEKHFYPKNQPLTITANILLLGVIEKYKSKGGREKENYRARGPAQSILTPLTENSWQTSGRLDETAERHETEGKRKWQSLSEGASTTLRSSKPLARKWYRGRKFVGACLDVPIKSSSGSDKVCLVENSPLGSYQEAVDYALVGNSLLGPNQETVEHNKRGSDKKNPQESGNLNLDVTFYGQDFIRASDECLIRHQGMLRSISEPNQNFCSGYYTICVS